MTNQFTPINETCPPLDQSTAYGLVNRLQLWSSLLRRQEEEMIAEIVPPSLDSIHQDRLDFLGDNTLTSFLQSSYWSESDLNLHLHLPTALHKFANYHFGPGLEEEFLSSKGGHDQIIYSVLRVNNVGLAQELWIRLEEGEANFADLAQTFGEGPESDRKGLIGPMAVGNVNPPELAQLLRTLKPGQLHPPFLLGTLHVLVRLEKIQPAKFDDAMRKHLLDLSLSKFIDQRVKQRLAGEVPDALIYNDHL